MLTLLYYILAIVSSILYITLVCLIILTVYICFMIENIFCLLSTIIKKVSNSLIDVRDYIIAVIVEKYILKRRR